MITVNYPVQKEGDSLSGKVQELSDYVYVLSRQVEHALRNIGLENFASDTADELELRITDPIYAILYGSEGGSASLSYTGEGLISRVEGNEGEVASLLQSASVLESRIQSAEGELSLLTQTSSEFRTALQTLEGDLSELSQTVYGITLSVTNGETSSQIRLMAGSTELSSAQITLRGCVTFADLSGSGKSEINGDNITTGTLEALTVNGCQISGSTFSTCLAYDSSVSGQLNFHYLNENYLAACIRLDDSGDGTDSDGKYRLYISTRSVGGVPFHLKLESAGGMSLVSEEVLYIRSGGNLSLHSTEGSLELFAPVIYCAYGDASCRYTFAADGIYRNGTKITS